MLEYDHVVVANGHHSLPRYPEIPGLTKWLAEGKASHSKWYRHPIDLGNTILVLGGGPSGTNISLEMLETARRVVHSVPGSIPFDDDHLVRRGQLIELTDDGYAVFDDGSRIAVDYCILGTGYQVSFPFLEPHTIPVHLPETISPFPQELCNSMYHVFPLAKHLFPIQTVFPPGSIAFIGMQKRNAPLPIFEVQAQAIVRVFADPGALEPTRKTERIIARYEELKAKVGSHEDKQMAIAKAWDVTMADEAYEYRDEMYAFAAAGGKPAVVVKDWEREMFDNRFVLRVAWRALEKAGQADEWVKDVGKGGIDEWVVMMRRLLEHAGERGGQGIDEPAVLRALLKAGSI